MMRRSFAKLALGLGTLAALGGAALMPGPAAAQDITTGLVGHWNFDEGTGADSSGSGNDITFPGDSSAPLLDANSGKFGGGATFSAAEEDRGTVPHNANLSLTSFTMAAWVKFNSTSSWQYIFEKGHNVGANHFNYFLVLQDDGRYQCGFYGGGSFREFYSTTTAPANAWHHVACTFDNATKEAKIYIDGVSAVSTTINATPATNNTPLWIGRTGNWNDSSLDGVLDEARIYGRALTAADVTALYEDTVDQEAGLECNVDQEAVLIFNPALRAMQYCNGIGWQTIARTGDSTVPDPGDTTPDSFDFADITNAALGTLITSAAITPTGYGGAAAVSVSGNGTPQISINGGAWTTSGTISPGQTIAVRLTSAATNAATHTAQVTIGGVTADWNVTTESASGGGGGETACTWTPASAAAANSWSSVAYGAGRYVAVSTNGTDRMMTSTDGLTWTPVSGIAQHWWTQVIYVNSKFVALSGGSVMTSTDGLTWTTPVTAPAGAWESIAYGNGKYVAVGYGNTSTFYHAMTSTDAVTWTGNTMMAGKQWESVAFGNGIFVAVAGDGSSAASMASSDGVNWTLGTLNGAFKWVVFANGKFYTGASQTIYSSTDGLTWTSLSLPTGSRHGNWIGGIYADNRIMSVGTGVSTTVAASAVSDDGVNWVKGTIPENTNNWSSVTYGGGKYVAVASSGSNRVMWTDCSSGGGSDTTPDAFSFIDQTDVATSATITSNSITIAGINAATAVNVTGGEVRINGGSWVTNGTITNGQTLEARLTSSASNNTAVTATITVGGVSDTWSVTTGAAPPDTTPDTFSFTPVTGVNLSTPTSSAAVTINGINTATAVSATNGAQFSINGGGWVTTGNITNGQTLAVRLTSSGSFSTAVSTSVTVGTASASFSVTTRAAANCTVASGTSWTVSSSTCTAPSAVNINHGATGTSTDATAPTTGSATYSCTDGTAAIQAGATCQTTVTDCTLGSWTNRSVPNISTTSFYVGLGMAYGDSKFVASGYHDDVLVSTNNGTSWTKYDITGGGLSECWSGGYGDGRFIIPCGTHAVTSTNGTTWTKIALPTTAYATSYAYGNATHLVVGSNYAATSTNGTTWTKRTIGSGGWSVTFANGKFVAVSSSDGKISTSADGITWAAQTAPAGRWGGVMYGEGLFVAVGWNAAGTAGAIATSPDGVTWTSRTAPAGAIYWQNSVYGNGRFLAVGATNVGGVSYMTSADGISWTRTDVSGMDTISVGYGNGTFIIIGGLSTEDVGDWAYGDYNGAIVRTATCN